MAESLSPAALHYGQAMCGSGDSDCAARVGAAWESDIEQRFGLLAARPVQSMRWGLIGAQGQRIGSLSSTDGTTTLCYDTPAGGPRCAVVGSGADSADTALTMLRLQGVIAQPE